MEITILSIFILALIAAISLVIKANKVYVFRTIIVERFLQNKNLTVDEIEATLDSIPSFKKMLFSFKPLTVRNWLTPIHVQTMNQKQKEMDMSELPQYYLSYMNDLMYLPISYKGVIIEQPYFEGKGNHSISRLEEICEQYKEYARQQEIIKQNCMKHIVELKFNVKIK